MDADEAVVDKDFESDLEKAGSHRGKLRRGLSEKDPELAKLFNEQSDAQRAWGHLIGKIIVAKNIEAIEDAFDWWKVEHGDGIALTNTEKITAFFHALASLGSDDAHYRILRRMFLKANTNE
jgi:hypothetical protein